MNGTNSAPATLTAGPIDSKDSKSPTTTAAAASDTKTAIDFSALPKIPNLDDMLLGEARNKEEFIEIVKEYAESLGDNQKMQVLRVKLDGLYETYKKRVGVDACDKDYCGFWIMYRELCKALNITITNPGIKQYDSYYGPTFHNVMFSLLIQHNDVDSAFRLMINYYRLLLRSDQHVASANPSEKYTDAVGFLIAIIKTLKWFWHTETWIAEIKKSCKQLLIEIAEPDLITNHHYRLLLVSLGFCSSRRRQVFTAEVFAINMQAVKLLTNADDKEKLLAALIDQALQRFELEGLHAQIRSHKNTSKNTYRNVNKLKFTGSRASLERNYFIHVIIKQVRKFLTGLANATTKFDYLCRLNGAFPEMSLMTKLQEEETLSTEIKIANCFQLGKNALVNGNKKEARKQYSLILEEKTANNNAKLHAYRLRARCHDTQSSALADCDAALKLYDREAGRVTDFPAHLKASWRAVTDSTSEEIVLYKSMEAVTLAELFIHRGDCLLHLNQYENALESYLLAFATLVPTDDENRPIADGIALVTKKRIDSYFDFPKFHRVSHALNPDLFFNMALCYEKTGKQKDALNFYEYALATTATSSKARTVCQTKFTGVPKVSFSKLFLLEMFYPTLDSRNLSAASASAATDFFSPANQNPNAASAAAVSSKASTNTAITTATSSSFIWPKR